MKKVFNWIKKEKWEILDFLSYWLIAIMLAYEHINIYKYAAIIFLVVFYGFTEVKKWKKKE